jgi:pyruvate,water dikinase
MRECQDASAPIISGRGASAGVAIGTIAFFNQEESQDFHQNTILVSEFIPPTIQSLHDNIIGIITAEGGILSHAACISRELGIPCIVGAKDALDILTEGQKVRIDGEKGEIYEIYT